MFIMESNEFFQCNACKRCFMRKDSLKRHIERCLFEKNSSVSQSKCDICGSVYNYKQSMLRHKRTAHQSILNGNDIANLKFECSTCNRQFARKDSLKCHLERCFFGKNSDRLFQCDICKRGFFRKVNLVRHCSIHLTQKGSKCLDCNATFPRMQNIFTRMAEDGTEINHEHYDFTTVEDFYQWKENLEKSTATCYRKRNCTKGKQDTIYRFICHRSGTYRIKTFGRQREKKLYGSKKVGYCPAQIGIRVKNDTGSCKVIFINTHLGHNICNKKGELRHIYLSKQDRALVKSKPRISFRATRNKNLKDPTDPKNDHWYLLDNKYSLNIKTSICTPWSSDPISVDAFVSQHSSSIIYYKKQNELSNKFPSLLGEDIVIIMMSDMQKQILEQYGKNIIMVDGTHGLKECNFLMHTLLVVDDDNEKNEVAFAISNRNDELLASIFFCCIKEIIGSINTRTLMTDMQDNYYKSWSEVMGKPQFRLFCSWHVKEDWRRNLKKITNINKRNRIRNLLYRISSTLDENVFLTELCELLNDKDPELNDFLSHFSTYYVNNVEAWAYCYRKDAHINTNMCTEAFHSTLKRAIRKRNIQGKIHLEVCLEELDMYLDLNNRAILQKQIRTKIMYKLRTLRKNHSLIENGDKVLFVDGNNSEGWYVSLSSDTTEGDYYFICLTGEICQACKLYCTKCEACIHQYECSCMESITRYNMCIHIHALRSFLLNNNLDVTQSDDAIMIMKESPLESVEEIVIQSTEEEPIESLEEIEEIPVELLDDSLQELKEDLRNKFENLLNSLDRKEDVSSLLEAVTSWEHTFRAKELLNFIHLEVSEDYKS